MFAGGSARVVRHFFGDPLDAQLTPSLRRLASLM